MSQLVSAKAEKDLSIELKCCSTIKISCLLGLVTKSTRFWVFAHMEKTFQVCVSCTVIPQGLAPARKEKLILVHITTQGRTQWRTPPCFDPSFLLYFHLIVRLTATGLSIRPCSKSLCFLLPSKSLLVSKLND